MFTRLFLFVCLLTSTFCGFSQRLSFVKFMDLFRSRNEGKIKAYLNANGYDVQPETKSSVVFFDTQIVGYKSPTSQISDLRGMTMYKKELQFNCLIHFTMVKSIHEELLRQSAASGFKHIKDLTRNQSLYMKGDTILTDEKTVVEDGGKDYVRYELGLVVVPSQSQFLDGVFVSKNKFSIAIPTQWETFWGNDLDSNVTHLAGGSKIELMAFSDTINPKMPTLMIQYSPSDNSKGFSELSKYVYSDELIGSISKQVGLKYPDVTFNFQPEKPLINTDKRQVTTFFYAKGNNKNITLVMSYLFLKEGTATAMFFLTEDDMKNDQYVASCLRTFKVIEGFKLEKD